MFEPGREYTCCVVTRQQYDVSKCPIGIQPSRALEIRPYVYGISPQGRVVMSSLGTKPVCAVWRFMAISWCPAAMIRRPGYGAYPKAVVYGRYPATSARSTRSPSMGGASQREAWTQASGSGTHIPDSATLSCKGTRPWLDNCRCVVIRWLPVARMALSGFGH